MIMMSWHRAAARKVRGVGHAIASLVDQQGDQTAPKRCPESPVAPIRTAPWRRFLSRTAIDAACAAPALSRARSGNPKTKKLQKSQDFCFRTRRIAATGRIPRTEITVQKAAIAQLKRCILSKEQSTQAKSQSINQSHAQATHRPARLAPQHSETPR